MPQLLIELFQEEIPARMQAAAAEDFKRLMLRGLSDRGLSAAEARVYVTPRRVTLVIDDLPAASADVAEELKGPRTNAPEAALAGFLKKTGLTKEQLSVQADPKGDFYIARIEKPGRAAAAIVPEAVAETVRGFPWPKSMTWEPSGLSWVRPLRSILCLFDGKVVPVEIAGLAAANLTRGHRQMANAPFEVRGFEDYAAKLRERFVMLDRAERMASIRTQALAAAAAAGLSFLEDDELLEEVAGLVEWPVVLTAAFDPSFLAVPQEVLISTMRKNQKYFALTDEAGRLSEKFLIVSNLEARDGGAAIVAGNERVVRARLSDAKFFWEQDLKTTLEARLPRLKDIVFHAKLGTQWDRVQRIERLAGEIAERLDADPAEARLAARLAKADLVSGTVGEFPEVQGIIGGYLARAEGLPATVADAIADHYRPQGPTDSVPSSPISIVVALADKIDTLAGFFAIDEKPTGSKDPFALRRAALGVVRIVLERGLRLPLGEAIARAMAPGEAGPASADLIAFFADRLKVSLREKGVRHDLIDAVFALGGQDDLVLLVARVGALQAFLGSDDGANLLAGYKRAANILRIEEKREKVTFDGSVDPELLATGEERALYAAIATAVDLIEAEIARERFDAAMGVLANLRGPVDAFFETVKVNDDDPAVRINRLNLLARIKQAAHLVADFSKIEG
ncbi:MAG: glycine--tRNA ligase subunit beta [Alphaproteobacteria bacterium]